MTLIVGLRGVGISYLASDSRATKPDGSFSDDAMKWVDYGRHAVSVAAGDGVFASFLSSRVTNLLPDDPTFVEVREVFDEKIRVISKEYVNQFGNYPNCTLMLAGYDQSRQDDFDASQIGEVLSVKAVQEGDAIQSAPKRVIDALDAALAKAITENKTLGRGDRIAVELPKSELIAYEINIDATGIKINRSEADTFTALVFGMDTRVNKLELPLERIADIYFRDIKDQSPEDVRMIATIHFIQFIKDIIRERRYNGVGGNIVPIVITPEASILVTAIVGKVDIKTGKTEVVNDLKVLNEKLYYKDTDGQYKPYMTLEDYKTIAGFDTQFKI